MDLIQNHLNMLTCTHQTAPSLRHTLSTRLETALQAMRTPVRAARPLPTISPGQPRTGTESVDQIVDTWQLHARQASDPSISTGDSGPASGGIPGSGGAGGGGGRGSGSGMVPASGGFEQQLPPGTGAFPERGFLFMDQAPDLGILPNLPNIDVDSNAVAEWPPFLLNLFGYDGAGSGGGGGVGAGSQAFQGGM